MIRAEALIKAAHGEREERAAAHKAAQRLQLAAMAGAIHKSRLGLVTRAAFVLTSLYVVWVLYSITHHTTFTPALKGTSSPSSSARASPHRKTLQK